MQVRNCAVVNEAHEIVEQSVPDQDDAHEHSDVPNESMVSEDDYDNKQKMNIVKEFTEYDIMINKSFRDLLCLEGLLIGIMRV